MPEEPMEIERKYLIAMPDTALLDALCAEKLSLRQVYLRTETEGESRRVRRARDGQRDRYWYTEKLHVTDVTRVEREREIGAAEYEELLLQADPARRPIEKIRWRIPYAGHMLEIDVFPFWKKQAFCEVELAAEDEEISLPPWLAVLREVTEDRRYTNNSLALCVPEEDITVNGEYGDA